MHVGELQAGGLGDLGAAQIAAEAQRDDLALTVGELRERALEISREPEVVAVRRSRRRRAVALAQRLQRALTGAVRGAQVVDEEIARDDEQPGRDARPCGVVAPPRAQRALEGPLRQILDVGDAAQAVEEEAVDLLDVVVVDVAEIEWCDAGGSRTQSRWRIAAATSAEIVASVAAAPAGRGVARA